MKGNFRKFGLITLIFGVVISAVLVVTNGVTAIRQAAPVIQPDGITEGGYFIIQLQDAALANYTGDVAGLEATNPAALGARRLEAKSAASQAYLDYLQTQQDAAIAAIEGRLGQSVSVLYRYQAALNGIALWLEADQVSAIAILPEIVSISRARTFAIETDTGPTHIGAPGIWDGSASNGMATMGEGVTVAIIDTGINMDHPSFADIGGDMYDHTNPLGSGVYRGWCDPADPDYDPTLVCNDKLIGAYSYPTAAGTPEDSNGHGSHVAGTAAGNVISATVFGGALTISGVAPHANIISYDVCATNTCDEMAILGALNDVTLDADVVSVLNYSIGDTTTDPWSDVIAIAYLGVHNAGIVPVTSAGNAGPGPSTIGTPADAPWMLAVGASTHGRTFLQTLDVNGPNNGGGPYPGLQTDWASETNITTTISAELLYAGDVDATNFEGCNVWTGTPFAGRVALVSRGTCSFEQKANNAQAAGAVAIIVFNNQPGLLTNWTIGAATLPSVSLSDSDGANVVSYLSANPAGTITVDINPGAQTVINPANADWLAGFSSRGPNIQADVIKPDIAAPGVDILAADMTVNPANPPEFQIIGGTSMASPHVAGSAALLSALYPSWTPDQIRSALVMTAMPDMLKEDGTTPADPFDMGSGRVDLNYAALSGLVLNETMANYLAADPATGGDPTTLNIANMASSSCQRSCSWTRTVHNPTSTAMTWTLSLSLSNGIFGTVNPASLVLGAGMTDTFTVTLDTSLFAGPGGWYFGTLDLVEDGAQAPDAHMPIAIIPEFPIYLPVIMNES